MVVSTADSVASSDQEASAPAAVASLNQLTTVRATTRSASANGLLAARQSPAMLMLGSVCVCVCVCVCTLLESSGVGVN